MAWIVRSTVVQPNQGDPFVFRHFTVETPDRHHATEIVRGALGGYISVVGYVQNGMSHHFPAPLEYA
jgi:hypothetical protein